MTTTVFSTCVVIDNLGSNRAKTRIQRNIRYQNWERRTPQLKLWSIWNFNKGGTKLPGQKQVSLKQRILSRNSWPRGTRVAKNQTSKNVYEEIPASGWPQIHGLNKKKTRHRTTQARDHLPRAIQTTNTKTRDGAIRKRSGEPSLGHAFHVDVVRPSENPGQVLKRGRRRPSISRYQWHKKEIPKEKKKEPPIADTKLRVWHR